MARVRRRARAALPDRRRHPRRRRLRRHARRRRRRAARRRGGRPRARATRRRSTPTRACCARSSTGSPCAPRNRPGEEAARRAARRARARGVARAGAGARHGRPRARLRQAGPAGRRDASSSRSTRPPPYVSRGGEKLAHALDALGVDPAGLDCLDVGASTGGFTDVLLQRGAARVIALDVGYGQLHPRLRDDPRVVVLERTNARDAHRAAVRARSSSSATSRSSRCGLALPPVLALAAPGWQARRAREAAVRGRPRRRRQGRRRPRPRGAARASCARSPTRRSAWGASVLGVVDSGLPGPKGNREFFLHLDAVRRPDASR